MQQAEFELYAGVGAALTAWHQVEFELCRAFSQCLNPKAFHPSFSQSVAAQSFWAIHSFDSRLKFASAAMESEYFHADFIKPWKKIKSAMKKASEKRNQIAHGTVVFSRVGQSDGSYLEKMELIPFFRTLNDGKKIFSAGEKREHEGLNAAQLFATSQDFAKIANDMRDFTIRVFHFHIPDADINVGYF